MLTFQYKKFTSNVHSLNLCSLLCVMAIGFECRMCFANGKNFSLSHRNIITILYGWSCEKEDSTDAGCSAGQFAWPELHTCLTCPEGFYCPIIEAEPLQCIQGYYSTTGETECHICEAGYACPTPY